MEDKFAYFPIKTRGNSVTVPSNNHKFYFQGEPENTLQLPINAFLICSSSCNLLIIHTGAPSQIASPNQCSGARYIKVFFEYFLVLKKKQLRSLVLFNKTQQP